MEGARIQNMSGQERVVSYILEGRDLFEKEVTTVKTE
jgi:hypothetical protein